MTKKPVVLLISPGILKWTDMDFGLPHLVALGGWLEAHTGVKVEILDLNYEAGDHRQLLRTIESLGPFLCIGVSCYSSFDRMRVVALARFLKQHFPDTPLVTGGYHASAIPDDLLFDGTPFDAIAVGEAEKPMQSIVETLLGGDKLTQRIFGPDQLKSIDALPETRWDLLNRYWPRATQLGRKLQIYLSRGCPYHCTFCMERAKSGYSWRAHSVDRAVGELERLATFTDLSHWIINIADPLFGFNRKWRHEVLEGIVAKGLLPRQYWTLTRSDDLVDHDFDLLARARFAIGIGMESGSPTMLKIMQKGNTAERYLGAIKRLAKQSQDHGLNWSVNIIVGHPGETKETARETRDFVTDLFTSMPSTNGWLSVDPFRLYPGCFVHETMDEWEATHGAKFHHRVWWQSWYDHGFLAQHLEPSSDMSYEERVRWQFDTYGPLVAEIRDRFVGQGRSVDRVFEKSMLGQVEALSPEVRDHMIKRGRQAAKVADAPPNVRVPLGLHLKDPWIREREMSVRRLLDNGTLRSDGLIEALLQVGPERFMAPDDARKVLRDQPLEAAQEGLLVPSLGIATVTTGLELLEPDLGDVVLDATAASGWVAALLAELVGTKGRVIAHVPLNDASAVAASLSDWPQVDVRGTGLNGLLATAEQLDRVWVGAALPRFPRALRRQIADHGRAVAFLGPRYRAQDLVVLAKGESGWEERRAARMKVPILAGPDGWIKTPAGTVKRGGAVRFSRREAPSLCFHVLAHLDLGADAASLHNAELGAKPWVAELQAAYAAAPGRLAVHACALPHAFIDDWLEALRDAPPRSLQDDPGQRLISALIAAAEAERTAFLEGWTQQKVDGMQRAASIGASLSGSLQRLREQLYEPSGRIAPPLLVLDVPALGRHARATTLGGERVVATSLGEAPGHVLMQVFHEEMHPITDPIVLAENGVDAASRSTAVSQEGFAVHQLLEQTAVGATEAFLQARAPSLMHDFETWKQRVYR